MKPIWFNSIEISMRISTMWNPKEKNIVFNSLQFRNLNSNSMELHSIQVALGKFIQY